VQITVIALASLGYGLTLTGAVLAAVRVRSAYNGEKAISYGNLASVLTALSKHGTRDLVLVLTGGALSTAAAIVSVL
jgi:hypothetical protein